MRKHGEVADSLARLFFRERPQILHAFRREDADHSVTEGFEIVGVPETFALSLKKLGWIAQDR